MSRCTRLAGALSVAAALGAAAAPAGARPLTINFAPTPATWLEPVTVTIAGMSATACGAGAPRLRSLLVTTDQRRIDVVLEEPCGSPGPVVPAPFAISTGLGSLLPGSWTISVTDSDGETRRPTLLVYDVGTIDVDFPALVLAGQPFTALVRGFAVCSAAYATATATISPGVIQIDAGASCFPILNPPGGLYELAVQIQGLPAGDYEVRAIDATQAVDFPGSPTGLRRSRLRVWDAGGCLPAETALCLRGGRFRVEATWRDFTGRTGTAHAQPLAGDDGSGLLWFFADDNAELTVKVIDGCVLDGSWWVFLASASTVEYEVVVTDTAAGQQKRYRNSLGEVPKLIPDTSAFATCGAGGGT